MKKFIIVGVLVFAFALTANMAFAFVPGCGFCPPTDPCPCPTTTISQSNNGSIFSTTKATGITGMNMASSLKGFASVLTGSATAGADSQNQVGINQANLTGVTTGTLNVSQSNNGSIFSTTKATGITGMNKATVFCGAGMVSTGASITGVTSMNLVGSNIVIK